MGRTDVVIDDINAVETIFTTGFSGINQVEILLLVSWVGMIFLLIHTT
jgi:hypothetical protein